MSTEAFQGMWMINVLISAGKIAFILQNTGKVLSTLLLHCSVFAAGMTQAHRHRSDMVAAHREHAGSLTQNQKTQGALMIDIGGGTTDFILYVDGAVKQTGVLAVARRPYYERYLHGLAHPDGKGRETQGRGGKRDSR